MSQGSFFSLNSSTLSQLLRVGVIGTLFFVNLFGATWFIAPTGDDSNAGTLEKPFATLQRGHDKASAGDTVYLRGGTYTFKGQGATSLIGVSITKSGKSDTQRICYWAYKNEIPILDFAGLTLGSGIGAGIRVQGEWLHFKGLEICNVKAPTGANNGIWCNPCTHNIFELIHFHHNQGPGLSIANGDGDLLIKNCDAHDNYDSAKGGEDGDGFGVHYQTKGDTIILQGCRSWNNADDGYDFFKQQFPVIVENCWAYGNGYFSNGTATGGNGSGFKMGNSFMPKIRHTIRNCVSWKNRNQGFYANHSPGGTNWYNNTACNNGYQFDMFSDSTLSGSLVHVLKNNVGFPNKNRNIGASAGEANAWDLTITPANSDFAAVSDSGWNGPRQADGSLPAIAFLTLKEGSRLIDKGTDVGLPFAGKAPDLGAHEYGATTKAVSPPRHAPPAGPSGDYPAAAGTFFDISGRRINSQRTVSGTHLCIHTAANRPPRVRLYLRAMSITEENGHLSR